jgi:hypothetical protein
MELQMHKEITTEALTAAAQPIQTGLFMVFAYNTYYPAGGMSDYIGMALSLDQARAMVADVGIYRGGYQIVNHRNMEIVETKQIGWDN